MFQNAFGDFYGTNGVCFPLHIHDPWMRGWQYSAFVFVCINLVAMTLITYCYVAMFISIQVNLSTPIIYPTNPGNELILHVNCTMTNVI